MFIIKLSHAVKLFLGCLRSRGQDAATRSCENLMTPNAVEMPKFLAALTRTKPPADALSCHKGYSTKSISFVPILLVKLLATAHYKFPSSPDYKCIVSGTFAQLFNNVHAKFHDASGRKASWLNTLYPLSPHKLIHVRGSTGAPSCSSLGPSVASSIRVLLAVELYTIIRASLRRTT